MTETRPRTYLTVDDVKRAVLQPGGAQYWFTPETMRWFQSRVIEGVHAGHFFITSERRPDGPRRYAIRACDERGHIETVGETLQYGSLYAARKDARRLEWLTFNVGAGDATMPLNLQVLQLTWPHVPFVRAQCAEAYNAGSACTETDTDAIDRAAGEWYVAVHGDPNLVSTDFYYGLRNCFKMGAYGVLNMADWDVRE